MRGNQVNVKRPEPDTLGGAGGKGRGGGLGGRGGAGGEGGGHEKKKKETLWTAAEISRFFLPLRRIFPSNLHSYLAALAGTTKVFSTRPSGRLPATLSACLSASVQVLQHPPQSSVRALGSTVSGLSSTLHVT